MGWGWKDDVTGSSFNVQLQDRTLVAGSWKKTVADVDMGSGEQVNVALTVGFVEASGLSLGGCEDVESVMAKEEEGKEGKLRVIWSGGGCGACG